jgi:hypothetical protein
LSANHNKTRKADLEAEYLDSAFVPVVVFARSVAALSAAVDALCRRIEPAVV